MNFEECPILHPIKDLKLSRVACDLEVLERCGCMTFFFCDKEGNKVSLFKFDIIQFWYLNIHLQIIVGLLDFWCFSSRPLGVYDSTS